MTRGDLAEAAIAGASPDELERCPVPAQYHAAHLRREDEDITANPADRDVRRTLRLGDVPMPELAPDEVLIAVMASAVNYNTVWSALFQPVSTFRFLSQLGSLGGWNTRHDQPFHVLGSDAAGIIVRAGTGVRHWRVGDRVVVSPPYIDDQEPAAQDDGMLSPAQRAWGYETNFGGLAHFAVARANQLLAKPPHLSWEEAACNALCAATAYRMLVGRRGAQLKQGDTVLIWGAVGGLGSYAVQFVRNGGGIAIGVVGSQAKAEVLGRLGCDLILNREELERDRGTVDWKRLGEHIRSHLGEDPHIVFEHVGRSTFDASVNVVRRGGTIVTCGSTSGYRHEYDNRYLWMRLKRIIGSHGANYQESWETNRLISLGRIMPSLSRVYPLAEVGEALRLVQLNQHVGKVGVLVLAPQPGLGIEDPVLRARIGEGRLRLFRDDAPATAVPASVS